MSDDRDDEEIRLRDQIAIAAMQALITNEKVWGAYIEGNEEVDFKGPHPRTERIAIASYVIADEMRKARLKSFG